MIYGTRRPGDTAQDRQDEHAPGCEPGPLQPPPGGCRVQHSGQQFGPGSPRTPGAAPPDRGAGSSAAATRPWRHAEPRPARPAEPRAGPARADSQPPRRELGPATRSHQAPSVASRAVTRRWGDLVECVVAYLTGLRLDQLRRGPWRKSATQSGSLVTVRREPRVGHRAGRNDSVRHVVGVVLDAVERYQAPVALVVGPVVGPQSATW